MLPKKATRILKQTLKQLDEEADSYGNESSDSLERKIKRRKREQDLEQRIQGAFLRFMASILKGYREYLIAMSKAPTVGSTDPNALFRLNSFLRSRDKTNHKFFHLLMKTQMFIRFIEECSFVSDGDQGLAFFDECSEKVEVDDTAQEIRFIEWETSNDSERTKIVLPPDCQPGSANTKGSFVYDTFSLDPILLKHSKRTHLSNFVASQGPSHLTPGSPLARRTKHEIKASHKLARKSQQHPETWAKYLLGRVKFFSHHKFNVSNFK